ncbi:MAG: hypothetical protein UZ18_ATM001000499 [Armatimonadetes bacterium OLB18]|nr:MAG: hypothetical protein UZ18_ATM001000499 [Armatimonadetes bacterium OLB18]
MRPYSSPNVRAIARTSRDLPIPGTPSRSTCPLASRATMQCSTAASCPTIAFPISFLSSTTTDSTFIAVSECAGAWIVPRSFVYPYKGPKWAQARKSAPQGSRVAPNRDQTAG